MQSNRHILITRPGSYHGETNINAVMSVQAASGVLFSPTDLKALASLRRVGNTLQMHVNLLRRVL